MSSKEAAKPEQAPVPDPSLSVHPCPFTNREESEAAHILEAFLEEIRYDMDGRISDYPICFLFLFNT
jgi:hypothetical protein